MRQRKLRIKDTKSFKAQEQPVERMCELPDGRIVPYSEFRKDARGYLNRD